MADSIDKVLESRRQQASAAERLTSPQPETDPSKFFSVLVGEGEQEHFLELRFRIGLKSCFSYTDLQWFNYDPEEGSLILEFGGFLVSLKGRGLGERLFNEIKRKRVAWVKEADTEMQDHQGNETFIQEITITPPRGADEEEEATPG